MNNTNPTIICKKTEENSVAPEMSTVPAPLVASAVLFFTKLLINYE
jgi:hypothetical protein